jgi:hypothetical protein
MSFCISDLGWISALHLRVSVKLSFLQPVPLFAAFLSALVAPGWEAPSTANYQSGIDHKVSHSGRSSIYLKSVAAGANGDAVRQRIRAGAYRGKRIRLTGWINTDHAEQGGAVWLRVDMENGDYVLDNVVELKAAKAGWTRMQLVAGVPTDALGISFGLRMKGQGQVWADDLTLEVVGDSTPTTTIERRKNRTSGAVDELRKEYANAPAHPVNLDFEQQ